MTTRIRAVGLAAGAALLLSACGGSFTGATSSSSPTASSPTTSVPAPAPSSGTPMDSDGAATDIPTVAPPAVPEGQRAPGDVGSAAMGAYIVATPVDADTWFRRLAPYLSDDARREYVYTDPANVAAHQLVGAPAVTRQTDYLATVTQGTDVGTYTVGLARDDTGVWKVIAITPPDTAGS